MTVLMESVMADANVESLIRRLEMTLKRQEAAVIATRAQLEAVRKVK